MKIGMIVSNFPKNYRKNRKAITSSTADLAEYFNSHYDVNVNIISIDNNIKFGKYIITQYDKFKVHRIGIQINNVPESLSILFAGKLINRIVLSKKIDLLHMQGIFQPFTFQKPIVPVILTIHGMWHKPLYRREKIRDFLFRKYYEFIFPLFIKNCSLLIHNSEYSYNYFKIYKNTNQVIIPLSLDTDFFAPLNNSFNPFSLCYIGNIEYRKGLHFLILSLGELKNIFPNIKLVIIGSYEKNKTYFTFLNSLIKSNRLEEKITFKGSLCKEEVIKELDKCNLFILSSDSENTPAVIAEAMARGKPVIASNVGGIKYMVEDGRTGFLFEVGDVKKMVEKIKVLIEDKTLRNFMSLNAKAFSEGNYRIEYVSKQLISTYDSLLKSNRKGISQK